MIRSRGHERPNNGARAGTHLIAVAVVLLSCGNGNNDANNLADAGTDLDYPTVSFSDQVAPIFRSNCAVDGCHSEDGKKNLVFRQGQDSTDAEIFASLSRDASNGTPLVDPGRPSNSEIILRIESDTAFMPPLQRLPIEQRNDLRFWVAQGAAQ